jgi:hypothetical protein
MRRGDVKKLVLAGGIALGLVLIVVAFVAWQQPDEVPLESAPRLSATVPVAPPPAPEPEAAPAPPKKAAATKKETPAKTKSPKPKRARKEIAPPPRPPAPAVVRVAASAPRGNGFKVKFKNLDVLRRLVRGDHVSLVLEYGDRTRFLLPRELDGELVALHVPDAEFASWVKDHRVSELEATASLKNAFEVHRPDVRYLAVLSPELRDLITQEAERRRVSAQRSIMIIDAPEERPMVSVLLPRR